MAISRRALALLSLLLFCSTSPICGAEEKSISQTHGQVHPSLPELTFTVSDMRISDENAERPHLLQVDITERDETLSQRLTYRALTTPDLGAAPAFVMLEDVNFDGYQDLLLLTAAGASNVFYAVALWHEELRLFQLAEQLELCNPVLYQDEKVVLSFVADGYRYHTKTAYFWKSRYAPAVSAVWDVYDAGDGWIGERLTLYRRGITHCWDEQYPEDWYYGQREIFEERQAASLSLILGSEPQKAEYRYVSNVNWVHLRRQNGHVQTFLYRPICDEVEIDFRSRSKSTGIV